MHTNDGACSRCTFLMSAAAAVSAARAGAKVRLFEIPLRACMAKDVDNLYLAGRCISGDFIPMASYRVTGSAVAMGEAVGLAAALRVQT